MNEEILAKYYHYLRGKYRKKNTIYCDHNQVKHFLKWVNKRAEKLKKEDIDKWKCYVLETYMSNGNARRIWAINKFLEWLGKKKLKLSTPRQVDSNKIILSEGELDDYLEASRSNKLWHLISLLQIDGKVRPGEICEIRIKNIDYVNQKLYLNDTKTGDNYIIMSPRLSDAIKEYMPYREPSEKFKEYLIIIPEGKYKHRAPSIYGNFIKNQTKKIAARAGIRKRVTPYIIKPSAITVDFDNNVNPKVIKRMCRHKRIETTLRYDHTSDDSVRKHFEIRNINTDNISDSDKRKIIFDRYIKGDIDSVMLKTFLDSIKEKERKYYQGISYV